MATFNVYASLVKKNLPGLTLIGKIFGKSTIHSYLKVDYTWITSELRKMFKVIIG